MIKNTLKTTILLAGLGGLFVAMGSWFGGPTGATIGLVIGLLFSGGTYWFSDKMAIRASGARPLEEGELPELRQMVSELAREAGLPMPRLYIAPSMQPNAFATGRNPKHAAVAVTQGILQVLDWDELRGVLAHELGHVKNRDILITSVAAAVGSAISWVANIGLFFGGGDDEDRPNFVVLLLLSLVAPIAAAIIQMAISRSREFEADRTGASLIRDGEPLARALQKIDAYAHQVPMNVDPAHATSYIINPLSGFNMRKMFSTHPPTEERVARLRSRTHTH